MESTLFKLLNLIVVIVLLSACTATSIQSQQQSVEVLETIIYLTRHAEKEKSGGKDPLLSSQGKARAEALAELLNEVPLQHIYTTKYQRTQHTAAPTATSKTLEVEVSSLPPKLLAAKLIKLHQEQKVLVVGHSNTVPEIIKALGVEGKIAIGHQQYGDLYIVRVDQQGNAELTVEHFAVAK